MQATLITMLMIFAGVSSHNEGNDDVDLPSAVVAPPIERSVEPVPPSELPPRVAMPYNTGYDPGHSIGRLVHQTIVSFFLGHDDDVMTAEEIEAAFQAGAYSGQSDYPRSAVLSFDVPR